MRGQIHLGSLMLSLLVHIIGARRAAALSELRFIRRGMFAISTLLSRNCLTFDIARR
jgi:hypothetical protein